MNIKHAILISVSLLLFVCNVHADDLKYRRSSLYSILIAHPEKEFGKDIDTVFRQMPIPDKYDDHNLKIRVISPGIFEKSKKTEEENIKLFIDEFIQKNEIAKRLVAKWFNRKSGKKGDGTFDTYLIMDRGLYDATYSDKLVAEKTARGLNILYDAGEDLIGNTYVLFNDIRYIDKAEESAIATVALQIVGTATSTFTGGLAGTAISAGTGIASTVTDKISGFRVVVTSYLYHLRWDDEIANTFYMDYYISEPDAQKKAAFEADKHTFNLEFVGAQKSVSEKSTIKGSYDKNDMIRKVCMRAVDKNIALLQKKYDQFRVKTPLYSTSPLMAMIGMKEDISPESRFEVLEVSVKNEKTVYNRVGVIKPKKGKIWDNRYMAETDDNDSLDETIGTEFEVVTGVNFYPGMLIREIR